MSLADRERLEEQIVHTQPVLRRFILDRSTDLTAGSWDLVSYSFQRSFEALWDQAKLDNSGLLVRPLLTLWRQSIELTIKAAILELLGEIKGNLRHDLQALFEQLLDIRADEGCVDDDELTRDVLAMIAEAQSFDPFADRFRYPTNRAGETYPGIAVNLDRLFQAHWIIITWCEGAVMEMRGDN